MPGIGRGGPHKKILHPIAVHVARSRKGCPKPGRILPALHSEEKPAVRTGKNKGHPVPEQSSRAGERVGDPDFGRAVAVQIPQPGQTTEEPLAGLPVDPELGFQDSSRHLGWKGQGGEEEKRWEEEWSGPEE